MFIYQRNEICSIEKHKRSGKMKAEADGRKGVKEYPFGICRISG